MKNPALIVVDLQRDFCLGGALPVKDGDSVVPVVNKLVDEFVAADLPVLFTRDWHPRDHVSFRSRGGVWPPHCVKDTTGARFHPSLHVPEAALVVSKATTRDAEAYSGFEGTRLADRLRSMKVEELYVAGLATDYCVKNTVIDGIREGFRVFLVTDSVRGVNVKRTDSATAFRAMTRAGAARTTSQRLLGSLKGRVAVSSSS